MTITSVIVVFAVIWFLTLFIVLPIGEISQEEDGNVVPGTPPGAPANLRMKRKMVITTIVATILSAIICTIIISGVITIEMLDVFDGTA
ncbi:Predicted secreted protein [Monaibacterium marinum]|uniref:Predicted secreted protein n=1 Tax=Pontivivens marinum TaxID=1690039 RepID=A0A2C9CS23_9RHOB|nr:DUF1467 family protein [Monaibacterium marinum]SOH94003.1 Predicted secreted protein [Monaibacterium marinum]